MLTCKWRLGIEALGCSGKVRRDSLVFMKPLTAGQVRMLPGSAQSRTGRSQWQKAVWWSGGRECRTNDLHGRAGKAVDHDP
jgi:hypothetical protein